VLTIHEGTIRSHIPKLLGSIFRLLNIFGTVWLKNSSIAVMNAEAIT